MIKAVERKAKKAMTLEEFHSLDKARQNAEFMRDSNARERLVKEAAGSSRRGLSATTWENRYPRGLSEIVRRAGEVDGDRVVIHMWGVGGRDEFNRSKEASQVIDIIRRVREGTGKKVEMHLVDISPSLLARAGKEVERVFKGAEVFSGKRGAIDASKAAVSVSLHEADMGNPDRLPKNKADIAVCTNILIYVPTELRYTALHDLASSVKKGGHIMIGGSDYMFLTDERKSLRDEFKPHLDTILGKCGLELQRQIAEDEKQNLGVPEGMFPLRKVKEPVTLSELEEEIMAISKKKRATWSRTK